MLLRDELVLLMARREEGKALAQFDNNGNLISLTDKKNGIKINFTYDKYNNITEVSDNQGHFESYEYQYGDNGKVTFINKENEKCIITNFFIFNSILRYADYTYDGSTCSFNYMDDFSSELGRIITIDINYNDIIISLKALTESDVNIIEFSIYTKDRIRVSYNCDIGGCITEKIIDKNYLYLWEHAVNALYDSIYINKCFINYKNGDI